MKKILIHALTSCYGCQLQLAALEEFDVISKNFEILHFPMISSKEADGKVDIAFVEGSVSTEKDLAELKEIRERSNLLVALGTCASFGGVQSWDDRSYEELYREVYGTATIKFAGRKAEPLSKHVHVDYILPGCPPEKWEIKYFLACFLINSWPEVIDYPVCQECRAKGNPCVLMEKGEMCLGPVTRGGCDARCPSHGIACTGCRGSLPFGVAWFDSLAKIFLKNGFSPEDIRKRMRIFFAGDPDLEKKLNKVLSERGDDVEKGSEDS